MNNEIKKGDKVKIINKQKYHRWDQLKNFFPNLIGYVNYISNKIVLGKTYIIIDKEKMGDFELGGYGYGFFLEDLIKIK